MPSVPDRDLDGRNVEKPFTVKALGYLSALPSRFQGVYGEQHQAIPTHVNGLRSANWPPEGSKGVRPWTSTFFEVSGLMYHSSITIWRTGARKCMIPKTRRDGRVVEGARLEIDSARAC
jgi:hypothetical protein